MPIICWHWWKVCQMQQTLTCAWMLLCGSLVCCTLAHHASCVRSLSDAADSLIHFNAAARLKLSLQKGPANSTEGLARALVGPPGGECEQTGDNFPCPLCMMLPRGLHSLQCLATLPQLSRGIFLSQATWASQSTSMETLMGWSGSCVLYL